MEEEQPKLHPQYNPGKLQSSPLVYYGNESLGEKFRKLPTPIKATIITALSLVLVGIIVLIIYFVRKQQNYDYDYAEPTEVPYDAAAFGPTVPDYMNTISPLG